MKLYLFSSTSNNVFISYNLNQSYMKSTQHLTNQHEEGYNFP